MKPAPRQPETFVFTLDGTRVFIGGTTDSALVIDVATGRTRWTGGTAGLAKPTFIGSDVLLLGGKRIDLIHGTEVAMPDYTAGTWYSAGAGNFLAIDGGRTAISVYAVDTGKRLWTTTHADFYPLLSMSPDGIWVVAKSTSSMRAFNAATGENIWTHSADHDLHTSHSRIKWSLNGTRGAAAGNRYAYVWSLTEPHWIARFPHGRRGYHPDVAPSPDGRAMAASAAGSWTIAYWPDIDAALRGSK